MNNIDNFNNKSLGLILYNLGTIASLSTGQKVRILDNNYLEVSIGNSNHLLGRIAHRSRLEPLIKRRFKVS